MTSSLYQAYKKTMFFLEYEDLFYFTSNFSTKKLRTVPKYLEIDQSLNCKYPLTSTVSNSERAREVRIRRGHFQPPV